MSSWQVSYIGTSANGQILDETALTDVGNFKIDKTVGDSMWIKTGDIKLTTRQALPLSDDVNVLHHWLLCTFNNNVVDAFQIPHDYDDRDDKLNKFKTRLFAMQKKVFDDFGVTNVVSGGGSDSWGFNAGGQGGLTIEKIRVYNSQGQPVDALNRWGFSIGDLLTAMQGSENKGYVIDTVTFHGPLKNADDIPVLYRGVSWDTGTSSADQAIDNTFDAYNITWLDVLKFAIFAFNAFVYVKPKRVENNGAFLAVDIKVVPKINVTPSSIKIPRWKTRQFRRKRQQIKGVHLVSTVLKDDGVTPSFEYKQGYTDARSGVFKRDIDVADPGQALGLYATNLYWSIGDYDSPSGKYKILDQFDLPRPYFSGGLVEPFYTGMISDGDAYDGNIFYNGEDVLDHVKIKTRIEEVAQINRFKIDRLGQVTIQAIKIS